MCSDSSPIGPKYIRLVIVTADVFIVEVYSNVSSMCTMCPTGPILPNA